MAETISTASTTSASPLLPHKIGRMGATIRNTDANVLYLLVGQGTVSASNHTVALDEGDYFETPVFYRGEPISGLWAGDGSGAALVTEF